MQEFLVGVIIFAVVFVLVLVALFLMHMFFKMVDSRNVQLDEFQSTTGVDLFK